MSWFTDEALEQCTKTLAVYLDAMPTSGKALEQAVSWLGKAQRIRLDTPLIPHHNEEREIAKVGAYGYGLDVPWPITVIEYEHGGTYDVTQDYTRALSTRRIALCVQISETRIPKFSDVGTFDSDVKVADTKDVFRDKREVTADGHDEEWGAVLVWPLSYFDEKKEWEFCPGVVIIPREQAKLQFALAHNQYLALAHAAESRCRKVLGGGDPSLYVDRPMSVYYQPMMPELCVKLGDEHSDKMIRESSLDALWVMLGVNTAMSCKNVYINSDSKALSVFDKNNERLSLDPFRGQRRLDWTGKGFWEQGTSVSSFVVSDAKISR